MKVNAETAEMSEVPLIAQQNDCDVTTIDELSKEELNELQRVGKEAISNLEAEIHLLERKIKQFGPDALPRKDLELICRQDGTSNIEDIENVLRKEIDSHNARLKETVRLTGVTIEDISRQVLELDDNHCLKQFSLALLFMNRKVHLKYTLEDTLATTGEQGGKVTWFEIKFEEDINEAVGAYIAKAADKLEIHSVFSILKSFIQWQTDRDKMMKHFIEKYPAYVSQQTGKDRNLYLRIIHTKPDHPEFILEWSRKIVNSRVETDVTVEVNAPKELLEMDSKKILSAIPEMFAAMVKKVGLEKAIDGLIQMVISGGQKILLEQLVPAETPSVEMESPSVEMESPPVEMRSPPVEMGSPPVEMETPLVEISPGDALSMQTLPVETPQE